MSKNFQSERDGQIDFFNKFGITDTELSNNTDGIYNGNIFEFKLRINNFNTVLFQALKYLNHMRIKGVSIPANIILVDLNQEIAYCYKSQDFAAEYINRPPFIGAASKGNEDFSTTVEPSIIKYDKPSGIQHISELLQTNNFIKVTIDIYDVVGWSNRFYDDNPKSTKIELFEELREPKHFKNLVFPWKGDEQDFKYIMDLLNDKMHRKELGAFYTPPSYCKKSLELVRKAILQVPEGNDYIILDRCAGTGNLEEFLTDRPVNNITVKDLDKYVSDEFRNQYLKDKAVVIATFYPDKNIYDLTMGELEKQRTSIDIHDYIFDDELSHTVVNTYELKEWVVLNERIGLKVKMIIPPQSEVSIKDPFVNGGDALSKQFIFGEPASNMSKEYTDSIVELVELVKSQRTNIILFENPPYRDSSGDNSKVKDYRTTKPFVYDEFKKDIKHNASVRELSNLFIWSGWKYYLTKPNDFYILFSPVKYWKSLGLGNKLFLGGFLFNRKHFHASESSISCIAWQNQDENRETITLSAFDIENRSTSNDPDERLIFLKNIEINKTHTGMQELFADKRAFVDDEIGIVGDAKGYEISSMKKAIYNKNVVGHLRIQGFPIAPMNVGLTTVALKTAIEQTFGFYLRSDNFVEKLPLFAAKLYPQKNWFERDIYFTTADGGNAYTKDGNFLKSCLIFACLSQRNHCRSFDGSDGRAYRNELCLDGNTLATDQLKQYKFTETDKQLINLFEKVLREAKKTANYNNKFAYGTYQIDQELNTKHKDENEKTVYDYPELYTATVDLKNRLAKYYETEIQSKLFQYQLLK